MELSGSGWDDRVSALLSETQGYRLLVHLVESSRKPISASTQMAQVVNPYTNARGEYVATEQQPLSHFLAQLLLFIESEEGEGDEERLIISWACL